MTPDRDPRHGGPGARPAGTGPAAKEKPAREAGRPRAAPASDVMAGARPGVRTGKVVPGAGMDRSVVLRDAGGTVRLGDGHVAGLALTLAEATARETRPVAPPPPEAGSTW